METEQVDFKRKGLQSSYSIPAEPASRKPASVNRAQGKTGSVESYVLISS